MRQLGKEGSGEGQFKGIGGIATDASGDLYVTDSGNDRVEEFASSGKIIRAFGSSAPGSGQLLSPGASRSTRAANVWVLNSMGASEGGRVVEFSSSGAFKSQFGSKGAGPGQILVAGGIAFSGGHLYVSEIGQQRVQEFSITGELIRAFDEQGSGSGKAEVPYGIASDDHGQPLRDRTRNNRVQKFSPTGSFISAFGSTGKGNGQFSGPQAVAVGSSGVVYVADTGNGRVQEWVSHRPGGPAVAQTSSRR